MDNVLVLLIDSILTVTRKFGYHCVYIFHNIFLEKAISISIISQTNIFNIFPPSVPLNSVRKIHQANYKQKSLKYIPESSLWLNKRFIDLANKNERVCLTIDCSGVNLDGLGRFRTDAENPLMQTFQFYV